MHAIMCCVQCTIKVISHAACGEQYRHTLSEEDPACIIFVICNFFYLIFGENKLLPKVYVVY